MRADARTRAKRWRRFFRRALRKNPTHSGPRPRRVARAPWPAPTALRPTLVPPPHMKAGRGRARGPGRAGDAGARRREVSGVRMGPTRRSRVPRPLCSGGMAASRPPHTSLRTAPHPARPAGLRAPRRLTRRTLTWWTFWPGAAQRRQELGNGVGWVAEGGRACPPVRGAGARLITTDRCGRCAWGGRGEGGRAGGEKGRYGIFHRAAGKRPICAHISSPPLLFLLPRWTPLSLGPARRPASPCGASRTSRRWPSRRCVAQSRGAKKEQPPPVFLRGPLSARLRALTPHAPSVASSRPRRSTSASSTPVSLSERGRGRRLVDPAPA
jgi:hypothetical protein